MIQQFRCVTDAKLQEANDILTIELFGAKDIINELENKLQDLEMRLQAKSCPSTPLSTIPESLVDDHDEDQDVDHEDKDVDDDDEDDGHGDIVMTPMIGKKKIDRSASLRRSSRIELKRKRNPSCSSYLLASAKKIKKEKGSK